MMDMPYNFYIHYAPKGKKLHMHIEITPRKATWAGFEMGSGIIVNAISPEEAAEYYRT
jgi:UDPglucose--hexose-1-phosphate uridylyltransferase